MDLRIVVCIALIVMGLMLLICKKILDSAVSYCQHVDEMAKMMIEQYENYKELAETMDGWYHLAMESNHDVDKHYEEMKNQNEIILKAIAFLRKERQEEKENGMAV